MSLETCSDCRGSGMHDYGVSIGTCPYCHGDCVVRARAIEAENAYRALPQANPVDVACPACGAGPNEHCAGRPWGTTPHGERVEAADAEIEDA